MTPTHTWRWLSIPILLGGLALGLRPASGDDASGGDAPSGMLTFMAADVTTCPQGFRVATEAQGRLVVGVTDADAVGKLIGTALTNQEDRTHVHSFQTAVDLPYKSFTAANGGNGQGGKAARYTNDGNTEPAATGLPFVQLVGCVKQ